MSRGTRFSEAQLLERGFYQAPDGSWSKDLHKVRDSQSSSKDEQPSKCNVIKGKNAIQKGRAGSVQQGVRCRLIIQSYRTKLIDPNNPNFKTLEDCFTMHGIIPDDGPKYCDQAIFLQYKVKKGEEKTVIELLTYD